MFRSLGHRNFRLFFAGQVLSLVGTWMHNTASPWLVYRLTDDPFWLGVVAFAGQLPALVVAPAAGVVSDRVNRHRLIIVTQALAMLHALALAALVLSGVVAVWHVLALSLMASAVNAVDLTTRQAFLKEMLDDPADLSNAIALNSAVFNTARLVGPAAAGVLIAWYGEGVCFLANGLSYLAVIAALLAMRLRPAAVPDAPFGSWWGGFRDGVHYALGSPAIRALIGLVAMTSLFAVPYVMLMPVFVRTVLRTGAEANGLLLSAAGVGALAGSLYLATRKDPAELLPRIARCPLYAGAAMLAFSFADRLEVAAVLVAGIGLSIVLMLASCNTLVQAIVDDDKRGRVMSLYTTAFLGLGPFGSLLAGTLAAWVGVSGALRFGGAVCVAVGLAFALDLPRLRAAVADRLPAP